MVWLAYNGVVTVSLSEYMGLSSRDRQHLHHALNEHIKGINEQGGTLSGAPPRRER